MSEQSRAAAAEQVLRLTNRLRGVVGRRCDTVTAKLLVTLPLFLVNRAACQHQPLNQFLVRC